MLRLRAAAAALTTPRRAGGGAPTIREGIAVLAGSYLLAIAMHWPLVLHMPTHIAKDLGDPLTQAWQLAWDGHALRSLMLDPWQANIFWPNRDSLAFSDSLLGYAPFGVFASGPKGAITQYNLVYFFAYALAVTGPYVLGRTLGLKPFPALVTGLAYAWSPWRWEQSGHLQIISSGTIPLSIALLVRGYRYKQPKCVLFGWLVVAWQVLIGVSLGLILLYVVTALACLAIVGWLRAGRPRVHPNLIWASLAGLATVAAIATFVGVPYFRVQRDHPEATRTLAEVALYSPQPKSFIAASQQNTVWGGVTTDTRNSLLQPAEQTLFPGATILFFALLGIVFVGPFSARLRIGLVIVTVLCALFSLGLSLDHGRFTYRLLYDYAPGWKGVRTPGRLHTLTTLSLALLAGAGTQVMLGFVRSSGLGRRRAGRAIAAGAIAAAILLEGSAFRSENGLGFAPSPEVAERPAALADAHGPMLELPPERPPAWDYQLWSTAGFPRLVNGAGSIEPQSTTRIFHAATNFPDAPSIKFLRRVGVRTVVIHRNFAAGTPWELTATRSVAGLGISRTERGPTVVYRLDGRQVR